MSPPQPSIDHSQIKTLETKTLDPTQLKETSKPPSKSCCANLLLSKNVHLLAIRLIG
jgi:hypothetical protein